MRPQLACCAPGVDGSRLVPVSASEAGAAKNFHGLFAMLFDVCVDDSE
jgi:hypothetical protein